MARRNVRTVLAGVAAWLLGAAAAVGVGVVALRQIGDPINGTGSAGVAITDDGVASTPSDSPRATVTESASMTPVDRTVSSRGGTVVAHCAGTEAYLAGWSPAPGYRVGVVHRGPAATASLTFVTVNFPVDGAAIRVSIDCANAMLLPTITVLSE
jgi:hypothetical protein